MAYVFSIFCLSQVGNFGLIPYNLDWFAIGLKGEAVLGVWTYKGVDVALCKSLIPYRSHTFEVAGFIVSKIISEANQSLNKQCQNEKEEETE